MAAVNPISFSSSSPINTDVDVKNAVKSFALMPDEGARYMAHVQTRMEYPREKFNKKANRWINALPLAGALSTASLVKGSFAKKAVIGGTSALLWTAALGVSGLCSAGIKAMEAKSPKIKEARRKHPLSSLVADCAVAGGAIYGTTVGLLHGLKKVKVPKNVLSNLNNSKLATEFIPSVKKGLSNLASKAPEIVKESLPSIKKAGKSILRNAPSLILAGVVLASIRRAAKEDNLAYQNYKNIKDAQLEAAKILLTEDIADKNLS